jgi:hypothetical protein|tara:strand:+ start:220 stop:471 length:252 start_codon:yes stop_codon:yes gene_type:complete
MKIEEAKALIDSLDYVDTLHVYDYITKKLGWVHIVTLAPEDVGKDDLGDLTDGDIFSDLILDGEIHRLHDLVCAFAERKLSND